MSNLRAVGYVRVSTDEQVQQGFSLDAQADRIRAYAKSQDYTLSSIYSDDGYSAKDLERPGRGSGSASRRSRWGDSISGSVVIRRAVQTTG